MYVGVCAGSESMPKYFKKRFKAYYDHAPNAITYPDFNPDIIFLQIQAAKTGRVASSFICSIYRRKYPNAFIINWTGDKRNNVESWFYDCGKHVDITCFSNQDDVKDMLARGYRSEFLQIGMDTDIFYPAKCDKEIDIVFFANNHGRFPLSNERHRVINLLKRKYGSRFKLYGNGWGRQADGNLNGNEQAQRVEAEIYRKSKIAINLSHYDSSRYTSDRLFRAMFSGAFVISHPYRDYNLDFNNHFATYDSHQDLINKIDYYLHNEKEREKIAAKGCKYVHKNYTLDNMIDNIIKLAKQ